MSLKSANRHLKILRDKRQTKIVYILQINQLSIDISIL
nr:MAG TPA: hypothetical protein [Caudoviricetes sp.]